jgi:Zn-dependent protease/predicted transcriptional regulator
MQGSFKVGTVAGIEVRVHYTWLLALFFISWSLAVGYFPSTNRSLSASTDWVLGVAAALLLFASVLVHELGHSLVATARGLRVENITLFIFGGISSIAQEATSARDEFLVAVVGPLISLLLAAVFWVIAQVTPAASAVNALAGYLAFTNLLLGLFNIVPGFPLDGGRVLRSIVWALTGDMVRATRVASYVGQVFAFLLIAWGVVQVLGGDLFGGLWIAFIGWFLNTGAEGSRQQLAVRGVLDGVPVTTVMDASPAVASPGLSVRDFVMEHALRRGHRALPVVEDGRLVGIVSVADARHVEQEAWGATPVSAVMTRMPLKTLPPEADLAAAMELMVENSIHQLPIVRDGTLVGMVSRADVMRYMKLGPTLQPRDAAGARSRTVTAPSTSHT